MLTSKNYEWKFFDRSKVNAFISEFKICFHV